MLTNVFQMEETNFFKYYNRIGTVRENTYLKEWQQELIKITNALPELPLSNVWMCKEVAPKLPSNSVLHLGILNSLRSWNLFDTPSSVYSYSNVGGFGIDGSLSTCVGASLVNKEKLYFVVLGDLATFYDINILGNRHIGSNIRIIVSNNGTGYEMHCAGSIGSFFEAKEADRFFAAGGHNGNQSRKLLCHMAEDLGFEYIAAETKEEFIKNLGHFISDEKYDKPILFEVFVNPEDDDIAYNATKKTISSSGSVAKKVVKEVIGDKGVATLKKMLGK